MIYILLWKHNRSKNSEKSEPIELFSQENQDGTCILPWDKLLIAEI